MILENNATALSVFALPSIVAYTHSNLKILNKTAWLSSGLTIVSIIGYILFCIEIIKYVAKYSSEKKKSITNIYYILLSITLLTKLISWLTFLPKEKSIPQLDCLQMKHKI